MKHCKSKCAVKGIVCPVFDFVGKISLENYIQVTDCIVRVIQQLEMLLKFTSP